MFSFFKRKKKIEKTSYVPTGGTGVIRPTPARMNTYYQAPTLTYDSDVVDAAIAGQIINDLIIADVINNSNSGDGGSAGIADSDSFSGGGGSSDGGGASGSWSSDSSSSSYDSGSSSSSSDW
jgi:uncharacterized membrane protein YgcG